MHHDDNMGTCFRFEKTTWALSDSTETSKLPCSAFQSGSRMGTAWILLTSSPAAKQYDRFSKECMAGLFIMDCITREESRALR